MIGKIYEIVKIRLVEALVFDESFSMVDTLKSGSTFVVLECLGEYIASHDQSEQKIYKLKILTPTGIIGFSSFSQDEIRAIENA